MSRIETVANVLSNTVLVLGLNSKKMSLSHDRFKETKKSPKLTASARHRFRVRKQATVGTVAGQLLIALTGHLETFGSLEFR